MPELEPIVKYTLSLQEAKLLLAFSFKFAQGNKGRATQENLYKAVHTLHPEWCLPADSEAIEHVCEFTLGMANSLSRSGKHYDVTPYIGSMGDFDEYLYDTDFLKTMGELRNQPRRYYTKAVESMNTTVPTAWEDLAPELALAFVQNDIYFLSKQKGRRRREADEDKFESFFLSYGYAKKQVEPQKPVVEVYGEIYRKVFGYVAEGLMNASLPEELLAELRILLQLYNSKPNHVEQITEEMLMNWVG